MTGKKRYSHLSGGCAINYDRKKRYSRLSVGCVVLGITTGEKKRYSRLSGGCAINYDRKKKIHSSVGWVFSSGDYEKKKKDTLRPEKKDTVVCLMSARFWRLRPEKKNIQPLVCWVRGSGDYDPKKKRYSRLSDGLCCCIVFCSGGKF